MIEGDEGEGLLKLAHAVRFMVDDWLDCADGEPLKGYDAYELAVFDAVQALGCLPPAKANT